MSVVLDEQKVLETGKPADFSFKKFRALEETGVEEARSSRLGGLPERGRNRKKFLTRSVWLNNNKLKLMKNLDVFVNSILEYPEQLAWVDLSFNHIIKIDECILKFPNLKLIYLHGNCIDNIDEVITLRGLNHLKTVTFHGNPISNHIRYRSFVIAALPQVLNLDFTPVLKTERGCPAPGDLVKKLREMEKIRKNG